MQGKKISKHVTCYELNKCIMFARCSPNHSYQSDPSLDVLPCNYVSQTSKHVNFRNSIVFFVEFLAQIFGFATKEKGQN